MEVPGREIVVSLEPPMDELSIANGKQLYKELRCDKCHGEDGGKEGKLSETIKIFLGTPTFVYDLRQQNLYKSGSTGADIYQTLVTGLDGSPMNAYDYLSNVERWNLVHFLQSRYIRQKTKPSAITAKIISKKINFPITLQMQESVWAETLKTVIKLTPIRARKNPINNVVIQSMYNGKKIAIRMRWRDSTPDSILKNKYVDQSAIQFSIGGEDITDSPFYGMGEKNKPVNIWHWKADIKQKIIQHNESALKAHEKLSNSMSKMFLNPFSESSVEEINSKGIGTLTLQSLEDQQVEGRGYWENEHWSVIFIRDLETLSKWDVSFTRKKNILLAFALWDGDKKDMNANKVVSFWQTLSLQ